MSGTKEYLKRENDRKRMAYFALAESTVAKNGATEVALDRIDANPYQPRLVIDEAEVRRLADNIAATQLWEPIVLRPGAPERYLLVAGSRRVQAFLLLQRATIPARLLLELDDETAARASLDENLRRVQLCDYERYKAFSRMLELGFAKTQDELCRQFHVTNSEMSRLFAFGKLPGRVLDLVDANPGLFSYVTAGALAAKCRAGDADRVSRAVESFAEGKMRSERALLRSLRVEDTPQNQVDEEFPSAAGATVLRMNERSNLIQLRIAPELPAAARARLASGLRDLLREVSALSEAPLPGVQR